MAAEPATPFHRGSWAPVDACTLPTADQPRRLEEFDGLFATSLISHRREDPLWLRLRLAGSPDVETAARDLTAREAECCSFFDFQVSREDADVVVDVRVALDKAAVLDGLVAQAAAALA